MSRYSDRDSDVGARLTYFIAGATIGAVVALLFAPKSGRELREDLADATRKGVDRARETGSQLSSKAGEYYDAASSRAGDLAASARDAVTSRGERVTAAIEAGKQAYRDEKRRTGSPNDEPLALDGGQQAS
ncbi:MAG TPA: YtxH domain-containing protein [Pyrinomonadaceae bacterium]|nr:YtxH domain-containing protein [Pyrinomonadaceae bacterium]